MRRPECLIVPLVIVVGLGVPACRSGDLAPVVLPIEPTPTVLPVLESFSEQIVRESRRTKVVSEPSPEPMPTVTPSLNVDVPDTLFNRVLTTMAMRSNLTERERETKDKNYTERIDKKVAEGKLVIGVFGCGPNHEPPYEYFMACSPSIFVYDTRSGRLTEFDVTHDTRAPEVEEEEGSLGQRGGARRIDQAWLSPKVGGFRLVRRTLENLSGLPIHVAIELDDILFVKYVDEVLGGVEVDVPWDFKMGAIYIDKKEKILARLVAKGKQQMDGVKFLQFMKSVPDAGGAPYPKEQENNERKHIAVRALINTSQKEYSKDKVVFVGKLSWFINKERGKSIKTDPEVLGLVADSVGIAMKELVVSSLSGKQLGLGLPNLDNYEAYYFVAPSASVYPEKQPLDWGIPGTGDLCVEADIKNQVYASGYVEVPKFARTTEPGKCANPYTGNLPRDWWFPVRSRIREILTK